MMIPAHWPRVRALARGFSCAKAMRSFFSSTCSFFLLFILNPWSSLYDPQFPRAGGEVLSKKTHLLAPLAKVAAFFVRARMLGEFRAAWAAVRQARV